MNDKRKSIAKLKEEHDQYVKAKGKTYVHNKSKETYQFLFIAFDEQSNEIQAIYVLCAMPWLKFTRPCKEFFEKFTELGDLK